VETFEGERPVGGLRGFGEGAVTCGWSWAA
jgi:hypothetical protein